MSSSPCRSNHHSLSAHERPSGSCWTLLNQKARSAFDRWGIPAASLAALLVPLKLSLAYGVLIPLILVWIAAKGHGSLKSPAAIERPLWLFIIISAITSLFGINPSRSIEGLLSFGFFACSIPLFRELSAQQTAAVRILAALLVGQSIAALHSLAAAAFPELPPFFIGRIPESGQLAMTLPIAIGATIALARRDVHSTWSPLLRNVSTVRLRSLGIWLTSIFALLMLTAFSFNFNAPPLARALLLGCSFAALGACVLHALRGSDQRRRIAIVAAAVVLPLLMTAILINLKRGPWAGVAIATVTLFAIFKRRLVLPLVTLGLALLLLLPPVRERLTSSADHFFIYGGRYAIWQIGVDLITRHPLGIGYDNSRYLREFSAQIPRELKHFHNNILNLAAETGWLGLALFITWLLTVLREALKARKDGSRDVITTAFACALISSQVAGLVEYNIGDSEVWLVACLVTGLLGGALQRTAAVDALDRNSPEQKLSERHG